MEKPSLKSIVAVFTFFLLMLSAWMIYSAIGFTRAILTLNWPVTKGIVISAGVKSYHSSKGSSKSGPDIRYSYRIDTTEFISDRYSSTVARGSGFWAKEIVGRHPVDSEINVYYNPNKPKEAVLDRGLQSDDWKMLGWSSFFFAVVLYAFIKQLKDRNKSMQTAS